MRAYWSFFFRVNLFNVIASAIASVNMIIWFPVLLCTFGLAVGFYGFYYFYKNEFYLYHNLGFSKLKLGVMTFAINAAIALPLLIIISLL
ncbi:hypothetical protein [Flavobacterium beibuense]|uniref:Uncharacterized protein n=1 Tax=Flavobacterium beibuense TaxID=657326 RepID=A0A444W9U2_9FLAO|nr:hypothetical protein [Flavobacterium beibuense]RYJ42522.1 hypothetical protein NU09_2308 [Flavobacterium beibuense]